MNFNSGSGWNRWTNNFSKVFMYIGIVVIVVFIIFNMLGCKTGMANSKRHRVIVQDAGHIVVIDNVNFTSYESGCTEVYTKDGKLYRIHSGIVHSEYYNE